MLAAENQVVLDVPSNKPFEREALKGRGEMGTSLEYQTLPKSR
jgi:hypothetical protein